MKRALAATFMACALAALFAPIVACSSPSDVYPECDTEPRGTMCEKGFEAVTCTQHALPQTNGTCTLVIENAHDETPYVNAYVEDDYCCTDLDGGTE